MISDRRTSYLLGAVLIASLVLRLLLALPVDAAQALNSGGDTALLLQIGRDFVGGYDYSTIPIPIAPIYLLIVGIPQQVFSLATSLTLIIILQSIALTLATYMLCRIAYCMTRDNRVSLVVGIALSTSLSFLMESGAILTESFYMFFLIAGLWVYIEGFLSEPSSCLRSSLYLLLCGVILGLATLTRPVLLLFPLGLCLHLLLIKRWQAIPLLLISYAFMVLSWTAYTSLYYEWTVIGSNQFLPAIWRGAVEGDSSPQINDEIRGDRSYAQHTAETIQRDVPAYIQRRLAELSMAYMQPHGTIQLGGESLRALAGQWLQSGLSLSALQHLMTAEGFLPKLLIYLWHYYALIGGLVGMLLSRRAWRIALVLIGFIAYTTLVHGIGFALPRYLFPTYPFWWVFASITLVALWDYAMTRRSHLAE